MSLLGVRKCTLIFFVVLGMRSEGKVPKNAKPVAGFLYDNASAHRPASVKDSLAKISATILKHSPYFPDLAPADSCLLPALQSARKGWRICDATDITKNAK